MIRRCLGGCGALINSGSYCRRCTPRNGSTRSWRTRREWVMLRDQFTCQVCGAPAEHVDHIRPVLFGGGDNPANLQATCAGCNLAKGDG